MSRDHTPYEYGAAETDGGLADEEEAPAGREHGGDTVIVDGSAMSYRSYEKRRRREDD